MRLPILHRLFLLALATASLAACMQSGTPTPKVLLDLADPNSKFAQQQRELATHCFLPDDQKGLYKTADEISPPRQLPPTVHNQTVNGCASAKFRLDDQGKISEASILTEYPKGYGFGDDLLVIMHYTTYKPPASTQQWFYTMRVMASLNNTAP